MMTLDSKVEENTDLAVCIVRLSTSWWNDKAGAYTKKSLTFLKRKSKGFNIFEEDLSMVGAFEVLDRVENLYECKDGIYQLITINERGSDWEMPHIIDEYDYKLIPYEK